MCAYTIKIRAYAKYRASWRRGPLRQKLCSGLLEPTGPWGQESQLTLAPTGSHPHRPAGRTKIVLPSPRLSPIHHPKPMSFQRRAGGRNDMQTPAVRGVVVPMVWKRVVMDVRIKAWVGRVGSEALAPRGPPNHSTLPRYLSPLLPNPSSCPPIRHGTSPLRVARHFVPGRSPCIKVTRIVEAGSPPSKAM